MRVLFSGSAKAPCVVSDDSSATAGGGVGQKSARGSDSYRSPAIFLFVQNSEHFSNSQGRNPELFVGRQESDGR